MNISQVLNSSSAPVKIYAATEQMIKEIVPVRDGIEEIANVLFLQVRSVVDFASQDT